MGTDMITLVLGLSSSHGEVFDRYDFGFVKLTKEYTDRLLKMHQRFENLKRVHNPSSIEGGLLNMEYFDDSIDVFNNGPWEPAEDVKLPETADKFTEVKREWEPPEWSVNNVTCRTVHVEENGFRWECSPKHSEVWLKSALVSVADMKRYVLELR